MFRPFFLFAKVSGGSGKAKIELERIGTDGKPFSKPGHVPVKFGPNGRADIVIQISFTPLAGEGRLKFNLHINGQAVGWPCEIQVKKKRSRG
jgi:hypothetical protein